MLSKTHNSTTAGDRRAEKQPETLHGHHLGDLRTPGLLGKRPIIGALMIVFGLVLFSALVINLETSGPLLQTDTQIANDLHVQALQSGPAMHTFQDIGFYLGEHVILAIGALLRV